MAITSDIRKKMGIKFGDTVILKGDIGCAGTYQVHDEMNKRFRTRCIIRKGTGLCIKGDIASMPGGRCTISVTK